MTKEERTKRGQVRHGKLTYAIRADVARAIGASVGGAAEASEAETNRRVACATLSHLFMRDDGWLRAVPTADGKSLYLKWKFSRGKFAGYYVMAVVEVWQWDYGLTLLADKLEAVDMDIKKPTKDTPWSDDESLG